MTRLTRRTFIASVPPLLAATQIPAWAAPAADRDLIAAQKGEPAIVKLYRQQFDVIWIYTRTREARSLEGPWQSRAAWFAPELPASFHVPGFSPQGSHDGLYWTKAP